MSTDENKRLVRRDYEEIVGTGDVDRLDEFVAPDYVEVHENVVHPIGRDGAREHVLGVRRTDPDLRLTVEQQIAEGDWVVTRVTARGTHEGVWLGMRPTGEEVAFSAVNVDRVVGGRIVEHGGAASLLEPLLRLGAVRITDPVGEGDDALPVSSVGALVLFSGRFDGVVGFYRAVGLPLEREQHGDGPVHAACDLAGTHIAVFASPPGEAPEHRRGGSMLFGLSVPDLEPLLDGARSAGGVVVEEPTRYPWGRRALVRDPDGRTVEFFQRPENAARGAGR